MRKHPFLLIIIAAAGAALASLPRPASAQEVLRFWYRIAERVDRRQLERDQARLQDDMSRGDSARVDHDLEQIRRDEFWLSVDRNGRRFGPAPPLPRPTALSAGPGPTPLYPGPGDELSHSAQPVQPVQSLPAVSPAQGGAPSITPATDSTPGTPKRPKISVVIFNPDKTRVAVNYVVDGVIYRTESGGLERLVTGPKSTIRYDRGGNFGVQQYALSPGEYEFRSSERGWALVKLRTAEREEASSTVEAHLAPLDQNPQPGAPEHDESAGQRDRP